MLLVLAVLLLLQGRQGQQRWQGQQGQQRWVQGRGLRQRQAGMG